MVEPLIVEKSRRYNLAFIDYPGPGRGDKMECRSTGTWRWIARKCASSSAMTVCNIKYRTPTLTFVVCECGIYNRINATNPVVPRGHYKRYRS